MFMLKAHRPEKFRESFATQTAPQWNREDLAHLTNGELEDAIAQKLSRNQVDVLIASRKAAGILV